MAKKYEIEEQLDEAAFVAESQIPIHFPEEEIENPDTLRLLSLFSGCGGMDIGFEGGFIAPRKSFCEGAECVERIIDEDWVMLKKNRFSTIFANDILPEAEAGWTTFMSRHHHNANTYKRISLVDLVKMHNHGADIFPPNVDVVTGGFPCQDFSVAGKRKGFESHKDHEGKLRTGDIPSEESRGKLYFWMKQVIDITRPKVFLAETSTIFVTETK